MASGSSALTGKVALVTGASSGIGEATALALAAAGAGVAIAARRVDRLEALAARIEKAGGSALRIEADVTSAGDVTAMVDKVIAEWGRLDILINNAGIMLLSPAADAALDDWRRMVELNLLALMGVTKAALPHLKVAKGHIVNAVSYTHLRTCRFRFWSLLRSRRSLLVEVGKGVSRCTNGFKQRMLAGRMRIG